MSLGKNSKIGQESNLVINGLRPQRKTVWKRNANIYQSIGYWIVAAESTAQSVSQMTQMGLRKWTPYETLSQLATKHH